MKSLMVTTFALLGWAWYSLSGGANFEPGMHSVELPNLIAGGFVTSAEARPAAAPEVTRASTASLADVSAPESAAPVAGGVTDDVIDVALAAVPDQPISASFDPESSAGSAAPAVASAATPSDLRQVTGSRVNLRYGPGTDYSVVGQLAEGDEVEVLSDPGDGWVKLQARNGGTAGWMYDAYLSADAN
ncbi:SH3 domain-containing protein [Alloyangia pacifica]|uniref:SH3 domain-containing protein n=1 Tax=Alloyangia pacifica TaxID=311180 RepID=UPI001CFF4880|nr:SH3 domain-containing protein [Alloyangia pacifica]